MQGKVEICGVNTARLPVLKGAETRALLEKAHAGDRSAREELISGNLRLVLSVVQKFGTRREHGRPVSGRVHRAYKGDRLL